MKARNKSGFCFVNIRQFCDSDINKLSPVKAPQNVTFAINVCCSDNFFFLYMCRYISNCGIPNTSKHSTCVPIRKTELQYWFSGENWFKLAS
jgi:hypothetical protein